MKLFGIIFLVLSLIFGAILFWLYQLHKANKFHLLAAAAITWGCLTAMTLLEPILVYILGVALILMLRWLLKMLENPQYASIILGIYLGCWLAVPFTVYATYNF